MIKQKRKAQTPDGETKSSKHEKSSRPDVNVLYKALDRIDKETIVSYLIELCEEDDSVMEKTLKRFDGLEEMNKVFVCSISYMASPDDFKTKMESFGPLQRCKLVVDPHTKKCKGYGFVIYQKLADAIKAVEKDVVYFGERPAFMHFAVKRDEKNRFVKNSRVDQNETNQIYVKSLNGKINENVLKGTFSKYGRIEGCYIPKDNNGEPKTFGFVKFFNPEDAKAALKNQKKFINGVSLVCNYAEENQTKSMAENMPFADYNSFPPHPYQLGAQKEPQINQMSYQNDLHKQLKDLQIAQAHLAQRIEQQNLNYHLNSNPYCYEGPFDKLKRTNA